MNLRDFVSQRSRAYRTVFANHMVRADANEVLADLARFCRANESCVVPGDHDRSLVLEGRREVWLRIQQHLHLTDEQLMSLFNGAR